ncbi:MAG: UbiD family decarboxylase [Deltaproteobacteria bacterium]|nr:UbiD family decarboxylase [Deltaproteobacteria bacterium]
MSGTEASISAAESYKDLREWLSLVEKAGELRCVDGVEPDLEIGELASLVCHSRNNPAVLCDRLKGVEGGYRVLLNALGSRRRLSLSLRLPLPEDEVHFVRLWKEKVKTISLIPHVKVESSPVTKNRVMGKDIDIRRFPAPTWNLHDGGPYIGTGCCVITRSPEDGWVNVGTYRAMLHGPDALGFYAEPGRHGRLHREQWWKQGKPCPVAVVLGCDPLVFIVSSLNLPAGTCELDYAGGIKGEPVETIEEPMTGLPVPASAECVIAGESAEGDLLAEGPFGEWTGYYGSERSPQPVIRIKSILYRDEPIIFGRPPIKPPSSQAHTQGLLRSALLWNYLESAGLTGIKGVWLHEAGGGSLFSVISVRQKYPGHATQVGIVAAQCGVGIRNGRYVVVVDDDIDPADLEEVVWAICTRSDPERSAQVIRRSFSSPLDTGVLPNAVHSSRLVLDACKPYERIHSFPQAVKTDPERMARARKKWGFLVSPKE